MSSRMRSTLLIAQVGVAQAVVQGRCLLLAEGRGGQRHQDGALTLARVVTGGLAGHLGTTENASSSSRSWKPSPSGRPKAR